MVPGRKSKLTASRMSRPGKPKESCFTANIGKKSRGSNGTIAAALGLGLRLWLAGLALWLIGHMAAVWAARRDAQFVEVVRRHLRYPSHLGV